MYKTNLQNINFTASHGCQNKTPHNFYCKSLFTFTNLNYNRCLRWIINNLINCQWEISLSNHFQLSVLGKCPPKTIKTAEMNKNILHNNYFIASSVCSNKIFYNFYAKSWFACTNLIITSVQGELSVIWSIIWYNSFS